MLAHVLDGQPAHPPDPFHVLLLLPDVQPDDDACDADGDEEEDLFTSSCPTFSPALSGLYSQKARCAKVFEGRLPLSSQSGSPEGRFQLSMLWQKSQKMPPLQTCPGL